MDEQHRDAIFRAGEQDPRGQPFRGDCSGFDTRQGADAHGRGPHSTIAPPQM